MNTFILLDFDGVLRPLPPRPAQILAWQQAHLQDSWIALDDLAMTTEFPAHAVTIRGVFDEAAWARASELLARQR